jgi:IS4 transposase
MIPLELKNQTSGESISKESNRRIIKYVIGQKYFYILTNLMDQNDYPIEMLIQTYHQRWEIEEYFKFMKHNMKLEHI